MESESEAESEQQKQQKLDDEHRHQEQTTIAKQIAEVLISQGTANDGKHKTSSGKHKSQGSGKRGRGTQPTSTNNAPSITSSPIKGTPAKRTLFPGATSGGHELEGHTDQEIQSAFGLGEDVSLVPEVEWLEIHGHAQQNLQRFAAENYNTKFQAFNNPKSPMISDGPDFPPLPRKPNPSQGGSSQGV
jgi:hypothetical protein